MTRLPKVLLVGGTAQMHSHVKREFKARLDIEWLSVPKHGNMSHLGRSHSEDLCLVVASCMSHNAVECLKASRHRPKFVSGGTSSILRELEAWLAKQPVAV